ncbi:hypothetical protein HUR95_05350 [Caldalkalibacillus thermarum TA2.A1]|uniref:Uncharacterized protein n=3 Tax=Caldalkalibacillus TaxID=379065 RepID=A0A8X8IC48_CALTT|nr:hypothetical protein [Caldalkalibacillus thermarum]QZT34730.1 hypothetical protein HUR95_05350 [Caldalkalibacillus thermarum TA2.A1]
MKIWDEKAHRPSHSTESRSGNLDRGISSCPDQLEIASKEASKQIIRGGRIMKWRMWLGAVLGSVILFLIISLIQEKVYWYLLTVFLLVGLIVNFIISLFQNKHTHNENNQT